MNLTLTFGIVPVSSHNHKYPYCFDFVFLTVISDSKGAV